MSHDLWVTILAGGIGSRFWPVSTPERPKQLLPLAGPRPLIVDTVERALTLVEPRRLRILANARLTAAMADVLVDLPADVWMVEPQARGTTPVLAWAAWTVARTDPDAVLVSLHSDHVVQPMGALKETIEGAARIASEHRMLVTLGAVPDRVETGYGHIHPGPDLPSPGDSGLHAFQVEAFHEKPDHETAREYTEQGHLWNTGIFVWTARTFLEEVERYAPDLAAALPLLDEEGPEAFFENAPSGVVDRAILERSDRVACVRATFEWDDVGSWSALRRTRDRDDRGNVVEGSARVVDGERNVAWSDGGRLVLWGLDDVVAVRTGDVTLIMPRERAPRLKELLADLEPDP